MECCDVGKRSTARPRRGRLSSEVGPTVSIGLHTISDITDLHTISDIIGLPTISDIIGLHTISDIIGMVHTKPSPAFGQAVVWWQLRVLLTPCMIRSSRGF